MRTADVVVVGGGPAGLAVAIGAAQKGLDTVVLERGTYPLDKACGEGLMASGVHVLEKLGVRALLPSSDCSRLEGIRYVQEDGSQVEGTLPSPGLGVRRTALVTAMTQRARAAGVELREHSALRSHQRTDAGMLLQTDADALRAEVLVGADGLASPLRRAEGLEGRPGRSRRFGLRQHFEVAPWTSFVEVHLSPGVEAYITPTGPQRVGVAFLWEDGELPPPLGMPQLLARFPQLLERLGGASPASSPRGAGPFLRRTRGVCRERLALVGDAAGYVDAITGEGLSVAFETAWALVEVLPEAVRRHGAAEAFAPYERVHRTLFRRYAWTAAAVLGLARRPWLRRQAFRVLRARPSLFEATLALAVGRGPRNAHDDVQAVQAPTRALPLASAGTLPGSAPHAGPLEKTE